MTAPKTDPTVHTTTVTHPQVAGIGRKHQARCTCNWRGGLHHDSADARVEGERHVAGIVGVKKS